VSNFLLGVLFTVLIEAMALLAWRWLKRTNPHI
jgi:hypothetical protein